MKGAKALLALLAVCSACGGPSDSYSIVVVTVTAPTSLTGVTQLRADIANAGKTDSELFPKGQPTTPLAFDASFALALPKSRVGELDIAVSALDGAGRVLATGSGSVAIAEGARADVTIHLALAGEADAGPIDSGTREAGPQDPLDAGPQDAGLAGDGPGVDGRLGQDSWASDGAGGTDVPLTGGAIGSGGGGAGGVGGIEAGVGGSGGVAGHDAGIDLGGLGGSGGISPTGG